VSGVRAGYLGPEGTFSESALRTVAGIAEAVPLPTVGAVLAAVRTGEVALGLVPFENSLEGSVAGTLDDLAAGGRAGAALQITAEVLLPVSFALLGRPGTALADVRSIATIPAAQAQCRGWLRRHLPAASVTPASSTAEAARLVAAEPSPYDAAIASPLAGERYGLVPLAERIEDSADVVTRFVLVRRPGPPPPVTGADRTTVVLFERADAPGALLEILTEFAVRGVNLTRLESRPTGAGLGRYCFAVDCEGHLAQARVGEALSALHRVCDQVLVLGSYPRGDGRGSGPARVGTGEEDFAESAAWLAAVRAGGGWGAV